MQRIKDTSVQFALQEMRNDALGSGGVSCCRPARLAPYSESFQPIVTCGPVEPQSVLLSSSACGSQQGCQKSIQRQTAWSSSSKSQRISTAQQLCWQSLRGIAQADLGFVDQGPQTISAPLLRWDDRIRETPSAAVQIWPHLFSSNAPFVPTRNFIVVQAQHVKACVSLALKTDHRIG
jgi:hypothetical protein